MDDKELAKLAQRFLERATLKGAEVPAYTAVMHWLEKMEEVA